MKQTYNLDERMINYSKEVLKPKHYTCFQRLLGWRVVIQLAHFVEVTTTEMQGFGRISDMLRCINVSLTIC